MKFAALKALTTKTARKVPEVTLLFWVVKLLTTAMGESTSDYGIYSFNPYVVVILGFIGFAIALSVQFASRKFIPWIYWLTVLMVAVFGTMAADVIHIVLGVPYIVSTISFAVVLTGVLYVWKRYEGTLSIHSIITRQRELFYWATVITTFALGTAAGDLAAYTARLGFFAAGLVFIAIFAVPALGYRLFRWSPVLTFWFAYIMTRPIGASLADWTGKPQSVGGLGWGDGPVAGVLLSLIIILVAYSTVQHRSLNKNS